MSHVKSHVTAAVDDDNDDDDLCLINSLVVVLAVADLIETTIMRKIINVH